jgi:hypothetical protein
MFLDDSFQGWSHQTDDLVGGIKNLFGELHVLVVRAFKEEFLQR